MQIPVVEWPRSKCQTIHTSSVLKSTVDLVGMDRLGNGPAAQSRNCSVQIEGQVVVWNAEQQKQVEDGGEFSVLQLISCRHSGTHPSLQKHETNASRMS